MEHIGRFPKRSAQLSVFPSIDIEGSFPSFESVDDRINALELSLFRRPRKPLGGFAPLAEKTCHSASAPLIGRSARELRPLESGRPDPIREGRMCQKVR